MRTLLAPLALVALASAASAGPPTAPQQRVPARGPDGATVSWERLDELLMTRYARSDAGRDALLHLVRARLLDVLAEEAGLVVTDEQLADRESLLELQLKAAGEARDLGEYLRRNNLTPERFRTFLRRGIVQEQLARRALGIGPGRPVPPEQQELWLDEVLSQREVHLPDPPWKDGVVARCGAVVVREPELAVHLRTQLPAEDVFECCYQLLLVDRMRARMPDLSPEAERAAIQDELDRRRAEFAEDPRYQGATFEQVMAAAGMRVDRLARDPAIVAAALGRLWVERLGGEEALREAYDSERRWFESRFGAAVRARALFLRAARMTNPLTPRTFEEAEEQLRGLATAIRDEQQFVAAVARHSEDGPTRDEQGDLGWVRAEDGRLSPEARAALFERAPALAPGAGRDVRLLGPFRLTGGCVLLWALEQQPSPPWERMRLHVDNELRKRFVEASLPRESVETFLDPS